MSVKEGGPAEPAPAAGGATSAAGAGSNLDADADLGGEVALGSMLFTLVEPHRGHEVAYHRWYERDHFYAGCMIGPWFFAGRRWVATRDLKDLRIGAADGDDGDGGGPLFGDDRGGSYLALYWVLAGRHKENTDWATRQVHWLHRNERMFPHRDHIHTLLYRYKGIDRRDPDGVPPELALDHPFRGLAAVVVDRPGGSREATPPHWTLAPDSSVALVLSFRGIPLPPGAPVTQPGTEGIERREMQLWFADSEPQHWWPAVEAYAAARRASGDGGAVRWAGAFIPTVPGTDRYTDQLW
jgi:hypothetical protein